MPHLLEQLYVPHLLRLLLHLYAVVHHVLDSSLLVHSNIINLGRLEDIIALALVHYYHQLAGQKVKVPLVLLLVVVVSLVRNILLHSRVIIVLLLLILTTDGR